MQRSYTRPRVYRRALDPSPPRVGAKPCPRADVVVGAFGRVEARPPLLSSILIRPTQSMTSHWPTSNKTGRYTCMLATSLSQTALDRGDDRQRNGPSYRLLGALENLFWSTVRPTRCAIGTAMRFGGVLLFGVVFCHACEHCFVVMQTTYYYT